jgi:hypothetical protein
LKTDWLVETFGGVMNKLLQTLLLIALVGMVTA